MKQKEKTTKEGAAGYDILSIPNTMLEAAGIPQDSDITVETLPGVLLIGTEEPFRTVNQPLLALLEVLGIEPEEVMSVLGKEGYFDKPSHL